MEIASSPSFLIGLLLLLKSGGLSRACTHGQCISTFLELVLVLVPSQQQQNSPEFLTRMIHFSVFRHVDFAAMYLNKPPQLLDPP